MTTKTATSRATIGWLDWSDEAFDRAASEEKLILLDIGAAWCHWCHVMDRVTYEDPEVIALINGRFIPVRVDRDRLPDVDARMQRGAALINPMGSAGGWPLTVLLTPERDMLMKATFLPPRSSSRFAVPVGLIELLDAVDSYWRANRQQIKESAHQLRRQVGRQYDQLYSRAGELSAEKLDELFDGLKSAFDFAHGGFGGAPKFFSVGVLEFLLNRAYAGNEQAREMLIQTLTGMSRGGVHDQLAGGFHRYSVDQRWHVPHFEKMAYDNAALLGIYAGAYALTGDEDFARVAREALAWIDRVLADPQHRGFYASQDADVGLNDDGDYLTWTIEEVREVLGDRPRGGKLDPVELILTYYGLDEVGDVHGRDGRNVLHVTKTAEQLAKLFQRSASEIAEDIRSAKAKLLTARLRRTAPNVDKTIFADLNGMMIDAHLTAYEQLGEVAARDVALKSLDHLLKSLRDQRGVFAHYRNGRGLHRVGLLSDQAWMALALVHAYELTVKPSYLEAAETLADFIGQHLTSERGDFLSAPTPGETQLAGTWPMRSWQDSPGRSAASVAAQVLIDLGYLTGNEKYAAAATKALLSFAGGVDRQAAMFLGGYAVAADHLLNGPRTILVVGPTSQAATKGLLNLARRTYIPGGLVIGIDPSRPRDAKLLDRLGYVADQRPVAIVCRSKTCLIPAYTIDELRERLRELRSAP